MYWIDFVAQCFYFSGLAAAVLLGYYGMARPHRSPLEEAAVYALSLAAGFVVYALVSLFIVTSLDTFILSVFSSGWTTLVAAGPRIIARRVDSRQFSMGFLLRLTFYFACLATLCRQATDIRWFSFIAGITAVVVGFYLFRWGLSQTTWHRLWVLTCAWITNFFFNLAMVSGTAGSRPSLREFMLDYPLLWHWKPPLVSTCLGLILFFGWILLATKVAGNFEIWQRNSTRSSRASAAERPSD